MSEYAEREVVRLSPSLSVELTAGPGGMTAEWDPYLPRGGLTTAELKVYRRARDALLAKLASRIGGAILVVEV